MNIAPEYQWIAQLVFVCLVAMLLVGIYRNGNPKAEETLSLPLPLRCKIFFIRLSHILRFSRKREEAERMEAICMQDVMMISFVLRQAAEQARSPVTPANRRRMLVTALREWGMLYKTLRREKDHKEEVLPQLEPRLSKLRRDLIELTSGRMDDDPAAYADLEAPTNPWPRWRRK